MLNGDGNENGIKINRSLISKKTNLLVQHVFLSVFAVVFAQPWHRCFLRLKRHTSWLHIIYMKELSYMLTQYHSFLCSCSLLFFTVAHFHLADGSLLAASISHLLIAALNFHVFLPRTSQGLDDPPLPPPPILSEGLNPPLDAWCRSERCPSYRELTECCSY